MGLRELMQECCQAVRELLPDLPRPEQTALGRLVCGVVGSESAQLSRAGAAAPGEAQDRSKQRQAQRLVANERLEIGRAQRRLLDRVLHGRRGRVDLLLDATTNGASAHQAGTVTLCLALRWHGRAVPLVWRTWVADEPGQHWAQAIPELCALVAEHLPTEARVVLLADRGLGNVGLARTARQFGWHYLFRVQRRTRVRLPDGSVREIGGLVEARRRVSPTGRGGHGNAGAASMAPQWGPPAASAAPPGRATGMPPSRPTSSPSPAPPPTIPGCSSPISRPPRLAAGSIATAPRKRSCSVTSSRSA